MKSFLLVFLLGGLILLAGCNPGLDGFEYMGGQSQGSYAAILRVNGAEYQYAGENLDNYTLNQQIGKVEKKVPPEVLPRENYVSNYLPEGTVIFSVKENQNIVLAETEVGVFEIFERSHE